ncbi:hypothetical protein WMY93_010825 [Mugilogobius chulae]|uniref:Uncharacterized protein n=1 Tax=Mugilogobius chulae TaxID=88201 RepID=A0AAW0PJY9_9GOBI
MRREVVLLLVVVALSQSDALRCYCGGLKFCSNRIETCSDFTELCGRVIITAGATPNYFKGCMTRTECITLNNPGISSAFCCSSDLCNR